MPLRCPNSFALSLCAAAIVAVPSVGFAQMASVATVTPPSAPVADGRYATLPEITFRAANTHEELRVRLYRADGTIDSDAVLHLGHLLRDLATGEPSPVVTRTLQLLVRVANHFHADTIEVVSGYRSGRNRNGHRVRHEGYHSVGSAIDFRLPGQDMRTVAAFARTLAHAGVGWYPSSEFVHLDSRDQSYHWENHAGRGHHGWDRPLDRTGCAERDAAWSIANDVPWDLACDSVALELHPRTAPGAHRPHHASRDRHHRRRGHSPLRVFEGTTTD